MESDKRVKSIGVLEWTLADNDLTHWMTSLVMLTKTVPPMVSALQQQEQYLFHSIGHSDKKKRSAQWSIIIHIRFNSSPPSAAYMHQWIGSALVQIMACRLFGAKSLSKPMLDYCWLDPSNKLQWNFNRNSYICIQENPLKMSSGKWRPFCLGLNVLKCPDLLLYTWQQF